MTPVPRAAAARWAAPPARALVLPAAARLAIPASRQPAVRLVTGHAVALAAPLPLLQHRRVRRRHAPHAAQPIHALAGAAGGDNQHAQQAAAAAASSSATAASSSSAAAAMAAAADAVAMASGSGAAVDSAHRWAADAAASAAAAANDAAVTAAAAAAPVTKPAGPSNFVKRVVFGILLGFGGAAVIVIGQLPFLLTALLVVYQSTQEYFGIVTSRGISRGVDAPPPAVSVFTTILCLSIALSTALAGVKSGTAMCVAAFLLLAANVLANQRPTFAQLTSSVFGLFYCGYLPCFWLKLRNLAVPAPELAIPALAPLLPSLTVGLVATFITVACIIAADTGAYFVGKNLGRTKLTDISPKKTVEGAAGGLASAMAAALALSWLFNWPGSPLLAAGYGALMFVSSIFGDLIESIMKREAGMKDSGDLIPGHGGLLDRFDSYMFSGAIAWFYVTVVVRMM